MRQSTINRVIALGKSEQLKACNCTNIPQWQQTIIDESIHYRVECICGMTTRYYTDKVCPRASWNNRPIEQALQARVDELEGIMCEIIQDCESDKPTRNTLHIIINRSEAALKEQ